MLNNARQLCIIKHSSPKGAQRHALAVQCLLVSTHVYEPTYVHNYALASSVYSCIQLNTLKGSDSCFQYLPLDRLSVSDLADVQRKLYAVNTRWYNVGLELGLKVPTLDSIDTKHRGDPSLCFRETLKEWLKGIDPSPTWEAMVKALKSPTVGDHQLAEQIQAEHVSSPQPLSHKPPSLQHPSSSTSHPEPLGTYVHMIHACNLWRIYNSLQKQMG